MLKERWCYWSAPLSLWLFGAKWDLIYHIHSLWIAYKTTLSYISWPLSSPQSGHLWASIKPGITQQDLLPWTSEANCLVKSKCIILWFQCGISGWGWGVLNTGEQPWRRVFFFFFYLPEAVHGVVSTCTFIVGARHFPEREEALERLKLSSAVGLGT